MSYRHISRSAAEELAREKGLDSSDPRYRNAEILCQRAQGEEPPYEDNLSLAWNFEQLQRVQRDLFDKGLAPSPMEFRSATNSHAAKVIAEFPELITNSSQLRGIPGIGKETLKHIDELLETGRLALLEELEDQLYVPPVRVP